MAPENESRDPTPPQKRRRTAEGSPARYESSDEVGSHQRDAATSKRDGRGGPQAQGGREEEEEVGSRDGRSLTRTPSEKADAVKYYSPMDQSSRSRSRGRSASRLQSRSRSRSRLRSRSRYDSRSRSQSPSRSDSRSSSPHKRARSRSGSQSSDRTRSEYYSPRAPNLTPPREQFRPDYRPRFVLHGHTGPVSQVRISPNGRFIASASADATIKIWDASNGSHMDTLVGHMAGVNCVSWSPDSNTLASGSDDKAVRLWDRVTGRPKTTTRKSVAGQKMAPLRGHHNYVHCVAFSPKGNIIASGSYDEAVFLWDVRAGRLMRSLPAHSDPVSGIDFCPDGTLVVSCSTDGLM
jgi:COMPASS component SWD3